MTDQRQYPKRHSPRLEGYDYSQEGAYFVTICVENRHCLFGDIQNQVMSLNHAGEMIQQKWARIPTKFASLELDYFVVMPNHVHGIVVLAKNNVVSLSRIIQWFKTMTTNAYIQGVKEKGWEGFEGRLWQRSFHDHIIRNEKSLNDIREYVLYNPQSWEKDTFFEI